MRVRCPGKDEIPRAAQLKRTLSIGGDILQEFIGRVKLKSGPQWYHRVVTRKPQQFGILKRN